MRQASPKIHKIHGSHSLFSPAQPDSPHSQGLQDHMRGERAKSLEVARAFCGEKFANLRLKSNMDFLGHNV
jgi:hypothetical protein